VAARISEPRVTRWGLAGAVALMLAGIATVAVARALGKSGSRASIVVSVVAHWLAAYVLWSFAAGLAAHYGALGWYDGTVFGLLAVAGGVWQYRTHVREGRQRGLAVFVGGQIVWLVILMLRNGAFSN
jgi:hypothetical protein